MDISCGVNKQSSSLRDGQNNPKIQTNEQKSFNKRRANQHQQQQQATDGNKQDNYRLLTIENQIDDCNENSSAQYLNTMPCESNKKIGIFGQDGYCEDDDDEEDDFTLVQDHQYMQAEQSDIINDQDQDYYKNQGFTSSSNMSSEFQEYGAEANNQVEQGQQQDGANDGDQQHDMVNYKGIYYDDNQSKFFDPVTGAHFEYLDLHRRLTRVLKQRKKHEEIVSQYNDQLKLKETNLVDQQIQIIPQPSLQGKKNNLMSDIVLSDDGLAIKNFESSQMSENLLEDSIDELAVRNYQHLHQSKNQYKILEKTQPALQHLQTEVSKVDGSSKSLQRYKSSGLCVQGLAPPIDFKNKFSEKMKRQNMNNLNSVIKQIDVSDQNMYKSLDSNKAILSATNKKSKQLGRDMYNQTRSQKMLNYESNQPQKTDSSVNLQTNNFMLATFNSSASKRNNNMVPRRSQIQVADKSKKKLDLKPNTIRKTNVQQLDQYKQSTKSKVQPPAMIKGNQTSSLNAKQPVTRQKNQNKVISQPKKPQNRQMTKNASAQDLKKPTISLNKNTLTAQKQLKNINTGQPKTSTYKNTNLIRTGQIKPSKVPQIVTKHHNSALQAPLQTSVAADNKDGFSAFKQSKSNVETISQLKTNIFKQQIGTSKIQTGTKSRNTFNNNASMPLKSTQKRNNPFQSQEALGNISGTSNNLKKAVHGSVVNIDLNSDSDSMAVNQQQKLSKSNSQQQKSMFQPNQTSQRLGAKNQGTTRNNNLTIGRNQNSMRTIKTINLNK